MLAMIASDAFSRLVRGAALIGLVTLAVRIVALGRESMMAAVFGVSATLELFLISLLVPLFFILAITGSAGTSIIPMLASARQLEGQAAIRTLIARINGSSLLIFICVAVLVAILAQFYLPLLAAHIEPHGIALAWRWVILLCLLIPVYGCAALWVAIANLHGHVLIPAAIPAITPLAIIVMLLAFAGRHDAWPLLLGWMLGGVLELTVIGLLLRRRRLLVWPRISFSTPGNFAGNFERNFATLFASAAIFGLIPLTDQAMAAWAGPGDIIRITFGSRLATMLVSVGGIALSYSALPVFSALAAEGNWRALHALVKRSISLILVLSIPLCLLLAWFSPFIVRLLFQYGNFPASDTIPIASIQAIYVMQNPFFLCWVLLNSVLVAMRRRFLLLIMSACAAILNAGLNWWWLAEFGVRGIAAATSVTMFVWFAVAYAITIRRLNGKIAALPFAPGG